MENNLWRKKYLCTFRVLTGALEVKNFCPQNIFGKNTEEEKYNISPSHTAATSSYTYVYKNSSFFFNYMLNDI